MPTEFWYPISSAGHDLPAGQDAWTNVGGANKNASTQTGGGRAGPVTHDDDTTYISSGAVDSQALNISWPGPIAALNNVMTASYRHRANFGNPRVQLFFQKSSGGTGTVIYDKTEVDASYHSEALKDVSDGATYSPNASAWVVADFADDKTIYGNVTHLVGGTTQFVTSIWGELGYAGPAGGFAFILGLAGLMALQSTGVFADYQQFEKFLEWRRNVHPRHTILEPAEKVQAWDELKAHTWRSYFIG